MQSGARIGVPVANPLPVSKLPFSAHSRFSQRSLRLKAFLSAGRQFIPALKAKAFNRRERREKPPRAQREPLRNESLRNDFGSCKVGANRRSRCESASRLEIAFLGALRLFSAFSALKSFSLRRSTICSGAKSKSF